MEKEQKERKARGQFCGYHNGFPVYYSRPHFIIGHENRDFIRFLSKKEARFDGFREAGNNKAAKIYGRPGYIGPDRHKGLPIN